MLPRSLAQVPAGRRRSQDVQRPGLSGYIPIVATGMLE